MNVRQVTQRDLLARWCADQQVADLCFILPEFRFHTHDQIEQLLALDDLGCRLAAYGSLKNSLDVSHIDAVTSYFVAIDIDQQAGLAEFANNRQFGKSGHLRKPALDVECLALKSI